MMSLQYSGETGYKLQDCETIKHHIVSCTIVVDTTVQDKTLAWLLNVIMYSGRTYTMIN